MTSSVMTMITKRHAETCTLPKPIDPPTGSGTDR